MAEKDNLLVNGYRFGSYRDAQIAEEEIKKAKYFETKLTGKTGRSRLAVYNQILDKKVFQTPIGWEYLKYMQEEMQGLGIPEEEIRPIPMYLTFVHEETQATEQPVRQRIRPSRRNDLMRKYRITLLLNVLLGILVVAMFAITIKSDNPNILNYKNEIVNQYATWEQELTEREDALRKKEQSLQTNLEEGNGTIENTGG
ncbi:MAG: hypothetical protein IJD96_04720 [Lachnospiraceae bacterium]|nr:hypothetical protein [Lachnospiraceae bacterium]